MVSFNKDGGRQGKRVTNSEARSYLLERRGRHEGGSGTDAMHSSCVLFGCYTRILEKKSTQQSQHRHHRTPVNEETDSVTTRCILFLGVVESK